MTRTRAKLPPSYDDHFPKTLRHLLKKTGKMQKDLANYLSLSTSTISTYTDGTTLPDIKTLKKIAEYFKVSTDFLLGRTKVPTASPTLQSAIKYTGLSERSLINIRHLTTADDVSDDLKMPDAKSSLDYLLNTNNQAKLLAMLMEISKARHSMARYDPQKDLQQRLEADKLNAYDEDDGVYHLSPKDAADYHAQQAARYLFELCISALNTPARKEEP